MVGYLFGGLILGGLSDKIGRKLTFIGKGTSEYVNLSDTTIQSISFSPVSNAFLLIAGIAAAVAPE